MKLLRVRTENFRLLKDLEFEFSTDANQNLTVIRAANESGKTTLLMALQWGLFGDEGLPEYGRNFRLSPLDISSGDKASETVTVEIDCEIPTRAGKRKYRLIRFVTETVRGGKWERGSANVNLLHLTQTGADPVDNPEAHIRPHLPSELREVFFTDGDRALSFIEGSRSDQSKRVEGAIKSLLGLGVVEQALDHTHKVGTAINQKVRHESGNQKELELVSERLATLHEELPVLEEKYETAKKNRMNLEDLEQEAQRRLDDALRKGNRDELERDRKAAVQGRQSAEKDAAQAARDHANLFKSELIGRQLLATPFNKAKEILDKLHNDGKIPNQTIPVLVDRLNRPTCICGESLDPNDQDAVRRRTHIQHLIEESRNADDIQKKVTALYYGAQDLLSPTDGQSWADEYSDVFERRQRANKRIQEFGERESAVEAKIAALPDVDIQQLRTTRDRYREQFKSVQGEEIRLSSQIDAKRRDIKQVEAEREKLLHQDEKGLKFIAELEVAKDLEDILSSALRTMKTRELQKVSDHMNTMFLDMIGADQSQRSVIQRATITSDFRIAVYGQYDHPLDPSQDLNGASRRALTIAFILALTKVSEVEAPNVIDTPLGMMSGYVKQAVLNLACTQSSQLVLFLTHSEIQGCEDILDQRAGRIYTLTNPAHYPKILLNEPTVDDSRVILCGCNHRESCSICERRESIEMEDEAVAVEA